jgi:hypothetical protein
MTEESDEEFFRRLGREFTVGRSNAVFEELHRAFRSYVGSHEFQTRVAQLVDAFSAYGGPTPAGVSESAAAGATVAMAYAHAEAEGALLAIAMYLAGHEPPAES